jgi:hypothetical protein
MRPAAIFLAAVVVVSTTQAFAGEKELLDRFKKQNLQGREKLQAEIKQVLEQAQALEKDDPARAMGLLQDVRDRMLQQGLLANKEDRALAEPLWERIQMLRAEARAKKSDELRAALGDFKEYTGRMNEEFTKLREDLVPVGKAAPPGGPGFIAFVNGTFAAGWLHESPQFVVHATVKDLDTTYPPGVVAGVQTPQAYFLYQPSQKRFVQLPSAEFFLTAIASYPPARRVGFWMPSEIPPPPPGFYKRSAGAVGAALFARSAGLLMTTWAGPGGHFPERNLAGDSGDSGSARLYRDVVIELLVQDIFYKNTREDRNRFRDAVMTFLDRRPRDVPLSPEEIIRLSDAIAEVYPDRRSDGVTLAHRLNRIFARNVMPK